MRQFAAADGLLSSRLVRSLEAFWFLKSKLNSNSEKITIKKRTYLVIHFGDFFFGFHLVGKGEFDDGPAIYFEALRKENEFSGQK